MNLRRLVYVALSLIPFAQGAYAQCALPYNIQNGEPTDATKVMANYNALVACIGNVSPGGAANSIQLNSGSGTFVGAGPLNDGQLLIGVTGGAPQAGTLTAGTGIGITNAPGSVTISATGVAPNTGLYHQVMSATPTIASTGLNNWLHQGPASVSDNAVGMSVLVASADGNDAAARYMTSPTPPYTITALLSTTRNSTGYSDIGFGWYDGSAKIQQMVYVANNGGANYIAVSQDNNIISWNADNFKTSVNGFSQPIWFQIADDGTNVSFRFSQDGANFLQIYTIAKSSGWLGIGGYSNVLFTVAPAGSQTIGTIMSWKLQ